MPSARRSSTSRTEISPRPLNPFWIILPAKRGTMDEPAPAAPAFLRIGCTRAPGGAKAAWCLIGGASVVCSGDARRKFAYIGWNLRNRA